VRLLQVQDSGKQTEAETKWQRMLGMHTATYAEHHGSHGGSERAAPGVTRESSEATAAETAGVKGARSTGGGNGTQHGSGSAPQRGGRGGYPLAYPRRSVAAKRTHRRRREEVASKKHVECRRTDVDRLTMQTPAQGRMRGAGRSPPSSTLHTNWPGDREHKSAAAARSSVAHIRRSLRITANTWQH